MARAPEREQLNCTCSHCDAGRRRFRAIVVIALLAAATWASIVGGLVVAILVRAG